MRCVFCGEEFADEWSQPRGTRRASERIAFHNFCYMENAKKSRAERDKRLIDSSKSRVV